ncbi:MAG TPA: IPT/TIG domain-containing protein [Cytophagales bacterium]|nr:IPT/TIG domain-containing protein [Cytophagales bacterium]
MKKSVFNLFLFILILSLIACKKDDEVIKSEPNPPTDTVAVEITPEQRQEVLTKINNYINGLESTERGSLNTQVEKYLKTLPEFLEVGYSEEGGNVWGRFKDNALYLFVENRPTQDIPEPNWEELEDSQNMRRGLSNARVGLPTTDEVILFNSLGNYFNSSKNGRNVLKTLFQNKGYNVTLKDGTIANLMSVKSTGILYYASHGGMVKNKKGEDLYALYSSDTMSVANEKKYADDIKKDNIVFISGKHNYGKDWKVQYETHLGITHGFVERYMSLSKNAMIYIDACQSFRDEKFQNAFLQKTSNTGTYLGWTDNVDDGDAYSTALFYYDRLLAANADGVVVPETPKQRAFEIPAVFDDMVRKGKGKSIPYRSTEPDRQAFLKYKALDESITLLRPSIAFVYVDESKNMLYLWGSFGDDTGSGKRSVTVDGVALTVESWEANFIMCKIKPSGKGSAGDVLVKVGNHESNTRTLTEWRGVIVYKRPSGGSLMEEVILNVHMRRDINKYRDIPGNAPVPVPNISYLFFAGDSYGSYKMSGTASYTFSDYCTIKQVATWNTIQGELPLVKPFAPDAHSVEYFNAAVMVTNTGFQIKHLHLKIDKEATRAVVEDSKCPNNPPNHSEWTTTDIFDNIPENVVLNMEFDANFNIKGGRYSESCRDKSGIGDFPDKTMTIEWGNMTANFLPKYGTPL